MRALFWAVFAVLSIAGVQATWMNANRQEAKVERLCRALMVTAGRFAIHRAPLPFGPVLEWMATEQDAVLATHEKECIP